MKTIILRYGELYLKGNNQHIFKKVLINNIKSGLKAKGTQFEFEKVQGRFILKVDKNNLSQTFSVLENTFGLVSFSPCEEMETTEENIVNYVKSINISTPTFKISVNRADKTFKHTSIELEKMLGSVALQKKPTLKVNLTNPQTTVFVDIRENKKTYIYFEVFKGAGGLPLGTAGKGLLLLSGGIDSPVAGWQVAKRGLEFDAIHFHSYPYTSQLAKEKVITLAKQIKQFNPNMKLHMVSITQFQEQANKNCKSDYMIALMRRFMFKIAEQLAKKHNLGAIITGESLGQVASQTMESLTSTNSVLSNTIAFRPLLSFDKAEIIAISEKIGTYQTSILPYEDCCTVFLPKNPVIKPKLEKVEFEESKLDLEHLLQQSMLTLETINL